MGLNFVTPHTSGTAKWMKKRGKKTAINPHTGNLVVRHKNKFFEIALNECTSAFYIFFVLPNTAFYELDSCAVALTSTPRNLWISPSSFDIEPYLTRPYSRNTKLVVNSNIKESLHYCNFPQVCSGSPVFGLYMDTTYSLTFDKYLSRTEAMCNSGGLMVSTHGCANCFQFTSDDVEEEVDFEHRANYGTYQYYCSGRKPYEPSSTDGKKFVKQHLQVFKNLSNEYELNYKDASGSWVNTDLTMQHGTFSSTGFTIGTDSSYSGHAWEYIYKECMYHGEMTPWYPESGSFAEDYTITTHASYDSDSGTNPLTLYGLFLGQPLYSYLNLTSNALYAGGGYSVAYTSTGTGTTTQAFGYMEDGEPQTGVITTIITTETNITKEYGSVTSTTSYSTHLMFGDISIKTFHSTTSTEGPGMPQETYHSTHKTLSASSSGADPCMTLYFDYPKAAGSTFSENVGEVVLQSSETISDEQFTAWIDMDYSNEKNAGIAFYSYYSLARNTSNDYTDDFWGVRTINSSTTTGTIDNMYGGTYIINDIAHDIPIPYYKRSTTPESGISGNTITGLSCHVNGSYMTYTYIVETISTETGHPIGREKRVFGIINIDDPCFPKGLREWTVDDSNKEDFFLPEFNYLELAAIGLHQK